jgi:hypothetical protein
MSTGESNSPRPSPSWWNLLATPTVRSMVLTWVIIIVVGYGLYVLTGRRDDELRQTLSSTQSSIGDLDKRLRQGDSSAIAEIEAMRKQVQEFDRVLGAQRDQFHQLSARADEVKSRKAVEHAKAAVLQADVTASRGRLQKIKSVHAAWTARSSSLMTGDSGRKIAASPAHVDLVVDLLERPRPTDADLQKWELQLESLANPLSVLEKDQRADVVISSEHAAMLADLGQQLTKALVSYDQQNLLFEAILRETTSLQPTPVTLEQILHDRKTQAEVELAQKLSKSRGEARLAAEKAQAERLAQLEQEIVAASGKAQEEALQAKKLQADQLGKAERDRIAEETKKKEAEKRAEVAGLKLETREIEDSVKAAGLEKEFQRDLPEIKSLLTAFLTPGFKYRTDNSKGPASLSHISSQRGLELNATGSYAMAFLANSSDRPAGGLKNPPNQERIRRAQDLLIKYGELMVQKKMLDP